MSTIRPLATIFMRSSALLSVVAFCLLPQCLAAETLGPAGGTGGTSATSGCGTLVVPAPFYRTAPFMLIGVAGRSGNWVDQIRGICMRFDGVNRIAIWRGDPTQGASFGGQGGEPFQRVCPRNQAVVGFRGRAGFYVDRLQIGCQAFTDSGQPIGAVTWLTPVGGTGGAPFGPLRCAANGAVQFLSGRGGSYVDSIGLECTAFQFDFKSDNE